MEYDQTNDRFIGFCVLIDEEGLPYADAFALDSFEEIEEAVNKKNSLFLRTLCCGEIN